MEEVAARYGIIQAPLIPEAKRVTARIAERVVLKSGKIRPRGYVLKIKGRPVEKDLIDETAQKYCDLLNEGRISELDIPHDTMGVDVAIRRLADFIGYDKRKILEACSNTQAP